MFGFISTAHAQVTVGTGGQVPILDLGILVGNIYVFALSLAGVLAFIMVTWAGVRYVWSRGNPGGESDAKDQIWQALLGVALLFGAYLILQIINPGLLQLRLPGVTPIQIPQTPTSTTPATGGCVSGGCISLASIPNISCSNSGSCTAAASLATILNCVQQRTQLGYVVTRAYPPTGTPSRDPRHNNGCAVDIVVTSGSGCAPVDNTVQALRQCGAGFLNEYAVSPQACGGTRTQFWTGNHLHVTGC